jgi:TPR repeat protein
MPKPFRAALSAALIFAAAALAAAPPAHAGPLEDGVKAFDGEQYGEALKLLTPLAEGGNAQAAYLLGEMYGPRSWGQKGENRHGVELDNAKAIQWWTKAAEAGNAKAQLKLGWYLMHGKDVVAVDEAQGIGWLVKAAGQGEPQAQFEAGLAYWQGKGAAADLVEARKWFIVVAPKDGFEKAKGYLDEMAKQMTPEQIAAAETAAKAFTPEKTP